MHDLSGTDGIVALAAAGAALLALIAALVLWMRLRRLQADQRVVMGDARREDLVGHAAQLERAFAELQSYVENAAATLNGRMETAEQRLDGTVAHRGLVRYDAYGEMSGRQSTSIALLDARRSGIVLSSIHHRDQARLYVKQIHEGRGELELSPEELEAIRAALGGAPGAAAG